VEVSGPGSDGGGACGGAGGVSNQRRRRKQLRKLQARLTQTNQEACGVAPDSSDEALGDGSKAAEGASVSALPGG